MTKYFSKHPIIFLISFGLVVCCCLGGILTVAQVGMKKKRRPRGKTPTLHLIAGVIFVDL